MRRAVLIWAAWCVLAPNADAIEIRGVSHEPAAFDPREGETASIHFRLTAPALVTAAIFDGRNLRVRELGPGDLLEPGDHELHWDGRDARGAMVPPEAYVYTIEARTPTGESARWDLSDTTGGKLDRLEDLRWHPESGMVSYRLRAPSRVRIRIGLANQGPLLRTLVNWVPRTLGVQAESWNGTDASGVVQLADHPAISLQGESFTLSRNTVIVGPPSPVVTFVDLLPADTVKRAAGEPERRRQVFDYARQPIEGRGDFVVDLVLPDALGRDGNDLPVIDTVTPVRVELPEDDLQRMWDERSEVMFFLDGRFVFENEVAFLPMTWLWDPEGVNPGPHYLTVNVVGYEGHVGVGTVRVQVRQAEVPSP